MKNKMLLAVSGGPDSMYMLWKYRNRNIGVAHINYNFRGDDSVSDFNLVKAYCKEANIPFYALEVTQDILARYAYIKNKQAKARQIRYDFFQKIIREENYSFLVVGHNKSDFLETAIIQEEKRANKLFYGLEKISKNGQIIIRRPLLKYWKEEIRQKAIKHQVPFRDDASNFEPLYYRNKLRLILSEKNPIDKEKLYRYFKSLNSVHSKEKKHIEKLFDAWVKSDFNLDFFKALKDEEKKPLIFYFVNNWNLFIKLNSGKILGIQTFIESKKNINKTFVLNNNTYLKKENNKLKIINNGYRE